MMDKQKAFTTLSELIEQAEGLVPSRRFLSSESVGECQYWFSRIVALMDTITPQNSFYNQEARHLIQRSNRQGGIYFEDIRRLVGHLMFVRDAVNEGLLARIEYEIAASDFSDFLDHARSYHDGHQKVQAAIIASAVFEDTVRRIGTKQGITNQDQLEAVINALKSSGTITKTEAKKRALNARRFKKDAYAWPSRKWGRDLSGNFR